jgi:hypothetical protein
MNWKPTQETIDMLKWEPPPEVWNMVEGVDYTIEQVPFLVGERHPMYGVKHTEESRELMSKNHHDINGKNNPMYGRNHTDESRKSISINKNGQGLGVPKSEETRVRMSKGTLKYWDENKQKRTKRLEICGVIYDNAFDASKVFGIHPVNVRRRCRLEQYTEWRYVE